MQSIFCSWAHEYFYVCLCHRGSKFRVKKICNLLPFSDLCLGINEPMRKQQWIVRAPHLNFRPILSTLRRDIRGFSRGHRKGTGCVHSPDSWDSRARTHVYGVCDLAVPAESRSTAGECKFHFFADTLLRHRPSQLPQSSSPQIKICSGERWVQLHNQVSAAALLGVQSTGSLAR